MKKILKTKVNKNKDSNAKHKNNNNNNDDNNNNKKNNNKC